MHTKAPTRTGRVFDIQRYSIHDGPGIRTTVFLKGCPLQCLWCHNPEGISPEPLLSFTPDRCINCGACVDACPNRAHAMDPQKGHVLLRDRCSVSGECASVCHSRALEIVGTDMSADDVLDRALRDRLFFETSGGGITLSGGEPLLQAAFAEALLEGAKNAGVHTAVETCGHVDFARFARVMPHTDLFLYDIKETDETLHRKHTGVAGTRILDNLRALHEAGASVLVRLPIVPGLNDRQDHFERVASIVKPLPRLLGVEVMPYHGLGAGKRRRFGMESDGSADPPSPDQETVARWVASLRRLGVRVVNET